MCAVGLSLIFGTTGLTNFAHGEMVTHRRRRRLVLQRRDGVPLIVAALIAVVVGGLVGALNELGHLAAAAPPGHRPGRRTGRLDRALARRSGT